MNIMEKHMEIKASAPARNTIVRADFEGASEHAMKCFNAAANEGIVFKNIEIKAANAEAEVRALAKELSKYSNYYFTPRIKDKGSELASMNMKFLHVVLGIMKSKEAGIADAIRGVSLLHCYKTNKPAIYISTYSNVKNNSFLNRFDMQSIMKTKTVSENGIEDFGKLLDAVASGVSEMEEIENKIRNTDIDIIIDNITKMDTTVMVEAKNQRASKKSTTKKTVTEDMSEAEVTEIVKLETEKLPEFAGETPEVKTMNFGEETQQVEIKQPEVKQPAEDNLIDDEEEEEEELGYDPLLDDEDDEE